MKVKFYLSVLILFFVSVFSFAGEPLEYEMSWYRYARYIFGEGVCGI